MFRTFQRMGLFAACLLVLALPTASRAESAHGEMTKLAKKILELLKEQNQKTIAVGDFSGPAQKDTNAGPGFQAMLIDELEKLHPGVVGKDTDLQVKGRYARIDDDKNPGLIALKVTAEVFDKKDESILKVAVELTDTKDIARFLGLTVALKPDGSKRERHQEIVRRYQDPDVFIHGDKHTLISSTKDSPYSVEMLVKPLMGKEPAQPREATSIKGEAFVDVKIGEVYEVRVHNNSDQEVGVTLSIDGLDVFTFSDDRNDKGDPRFTHFILGPGKSTNIVGWHKTIDPKRKDNFLSFLVTEYGKGAASKFPVKSQGKVGTITAAFAYSFPEGTSRGSGETGFGPPVEVKQTAVKRVFDPPHDFVTLRYNR